MPWHRMLYKSITEHKILREYYANKKSFFEISRSTIFP